MSDTLTLTVPNTTIAVDITNIVRVEHRVAEVAGVTKEKSPELLSAFNRAWLELDRYLRLLEKHLLKATRASNSIKARLMIDEVPKIIEAKGLSNSKDIRDAILDADTELQAALEIKEMIECTIALLKGKQTGIKMAYDSVKKLYSDKATGPNPWLSAGAQGED